MLFLLVQGSDVCISDKDPPSGQNCNELYKSEKVDSSAKRVYIRKGDSYQLCPAEGVAKEFGWCHLKKKKPV